MNFSIPNKLRAMKIDLSHEKSLAASCREGIASSVMITITDYFIIPLGLFLGASVVQIGLVIALPHLLASLVQIGAARFVKLSGSNRRFLIQSIYFQAALLTVMAALPLLPLAHRVEIFILFIILFRVVGNLAGTAWGSLMSHYLPGEDRGRYFGWRAQITGISGVVGLALGGIFLYALKTYSSAAGFSILFLITAVARFISGYLTTRLEHVPVAFDKESDFTFVQFIRRFRESNFVKFVFYVASITFATNLAGPFISVHMLENLHLSYVSYSCVHLMSVTAGLVAYPVWGHHADVVGNARVLKTTGMLVPFIPLLWIFFKDIPLLIGIEFVAGFLWGGFNLCCVNFIFDAVSPEKRVRCLGYFNLINGIALFGGASLGGFLAQHMPVIYKYSMYNLFFLSFVLRLAAHWAFARHFKEVRSSVRKVSSLELFFSVVGFRPLIPTRT